MPTAVYINVKYAQSTACYIMYMPLNGVWCVVACHPECRGRTNNGLIKRSGSDANSKKKKRKRVTWDLGPLQYQYGRMKQKNIRVIYKTAVPDEYRYSSTNVYECDNCVYDNIPPKTTWKYVFAYVRTRHATFCSIAFIPHVQQIIFPASGRKDMPNLRLRVWQEYGLRFFACGICLRPKKVCAARNLV